MTIISRILQLNNKHLLADGLSNLEITAQALTQINGLSLDLESVEETLRTQRDRTIGRLMEDDLRPQLKEPVITAAEHPNNYPAGIGAILSDFNSIQRAIVEIKSK